MTRELVIFVNALVFLMLVICICLFLCLIGYLIFTSITVDRFVNPTRLISACTYLVGLSLMIVGFYKLRYFLHTKIQKPEVTSNRKSYIVPIMLILLGIALIFILPALLYEVGSTTTGLCVKSNTLASDPSQCPENRGEAWERNSPPTNFK